ncbi:MAG: DUF3135 domain-containing protein [Bacteroidota bacterium]
MKHQDGFFFEEWAFLARVDPEAFERRRQETIASFIRASGSQRAEGERLQAQVDQLRARLPDPRESLLAITQLMYQSVNLLGEKMQSLQTLLRPTPAEKKPLARPGIPSRHLIE